MCTFQFDIQPRRCGSMCVFDGRRATAWLEIARGNSLVELSCYLMGAGCEEAFAFLISRSRAEGSKTHGAIALCIFNLISSPSSVEACAFSMAGEPPGGWKSHGAIALWNSLAISWAPAARKHQRFRVSGGRVEGWKPHGAAAPCKFSVIFR